MDIGKRISDLRKENNETQLALAKKLNVSRQAVSKWENGNNIPDFDTLIEISKIYEVDINYFNKSANYEEVNQIQNTSKININSFHFNLFMFFLTIISIIYIVPFSFLITLPLMYTNITKRKYHLFFLYCILFIWGILILLSIIPGVLPPNKITIT